MILVQYKALIDHGSTHSYVNEKLVKRLSILVETKERQKVVVANGEKVESKGQYKKVHVLLHEHTFSIDFYTAIK